MEMLASKAPLAARMLQLPVSLTKVQLGSHDVSSGVDAEIDQTAQAARGKDRDEVAEQQPFSLEGDNSSCKLSSSVNEVPLKPPSASASLAEAECL